jgi:hypothetical protein
MGHLNLLLSSPRLCWIPLLALITTYCMNLDPLQAQSQSSEVKLFSDRNADLYLSNDAAKTYSLRLAKSPLDAEIQSEPSDARVVSININTKTTISAHCTPTGVVLSLFSLRNNGDIVMKWDLDADGTWDALLDRNAGVSSIFVGGRWRQVSQLKSIFGKTPTATLDGKVLIFKDGIWKKNDGKQ